MLSDVINNGVIYIGLLKQANSDFFIYLNSGTIVRSDSVDVFDDVAQVNNDEQAGAITEANAFIQKVDTPLNIVAPYICEYLPVITQ